MARNDGSSPLNWADTSDKFIKQFAYDGQGRLTEADIPGSGRTAYGWDWVANRTAPTAAYNDADQLTSFGGSSYTYNATGDLTAITGAGAKSFTYTNAGLLNTVTTGAATASMSWDSLGNRLSYTSSTGGTTPDSYTRGATRHMPAERRPAMPLPTQLHGMRQGIGDFIKTHP